MALPNEYQLTFSQYPDGKSMFATIETRFGGNAATKKTQKTLLKQQYEKFSATSAESLDSIFNRLQKIVSRLAILGLRFELLMSIDDLYNNFKIVEQKIKKIVGTSSGGQNLAFMTAPNSSSTNDANTAYSQVSAASPSDLEQIHEDDLEAMDLKWQLSLLSVRAKKLCRASRSKEDQFRNKDNMRKQGNKEDTSKAMLAIDGVGLDWSDMAEEQKQYDDLLAKLLQTKFEASTYKRGLDTVEAQLVTYRKNEVLFSEEVVVLKREASKDLDQLLESQITDKSKKGLGYSAVPPPHPLIYNSTYTILDLSYSGLDEFKEPEFKGYGPENNDENKDESMTKPEKKTVIPTAAKIEKPVKKSVRYAEMYRSQRPRGNQRKLEWPERNCTYHQKKKMVSGNNYNRVDNYYYAKTSHHRTDKNMTPRAVLLRTSLKPLSTAKSVYTAHPKPIVHCDRPKTHLYKSTQSTVQRPFYKKPTLTNRHFNHKVNTVRPRIINTARSYRTPVNTVRHRIINTARSYRTPVNTVRHRIVNTVRSYRTPVNTVRPRVVNTTRSNRTSVNAARANGFNAVKPSTCWVWRPIKPNSASINLNIYNYIDARDISKSVMAWFDGGYVAFGGGAYGGKISGKDVECFTLLKKDNGLGS
ncbi:hypothetical protein Tco_0632352 [Tanacetum coccineum]